MKVSVIVSTYSVERFSDVIRCLNSIEEQTLKPHEVLLVLDPVDSQFSTLGFSKRQAWHFRD
jgi:glycosyltransferase involved in cell wall biosynthesis